MRLCLTIDDGTIEDRCGNIIQNGDRILDDNHITYVIRKIIPPFILGTREKDGKTVKIPVADCVKTRWE